MDIRSYLTQAERGAAAALARAVGVHPVMVSQWASGLKPVPVERCAVIEETTGKLVRRWDLRPGDWWKVWPELIATAGAPAIPPAGPAVSPVPAATTEHAQACDNDPIGDTVQLAARVLERAGDDLAPAPAVTERRHPESAHEWVAVPRRRSNDRPSSGTGREHGEA